MATKKKETLAAAMAFAVSIYPVPLKYPERSRTYLFPGGDRVTIENVIAVVVRPSGNHRLEDKNGKLYIIAAGWIAIEFESEGWSF